MRLESHLRPTVVVVLATVLLGATGCAAPAPSVTPPPSPTRPPDPLAERIRVQTFGPDVVAATQEALAREGVATIAADSVAQGAPGGPLTALTGGASPLVLIDEQVRAIALDAWSGAGVQGSALDAQVTVPQGAPPPSIVLAAYVDLGYTPDATPGARLAASLVGQVDGESAADTTYPLIVQSLLVADMTREGGNARGGRIVLAALTSPCTAVTNFFTNALNTVFEAVKSKSSTFLATLWNVIVTIAHSVVAGLVAALTAPVTETITKIVGFVAVAVEVVSFLRPWTLSTAPDDRITRFSVGNESSITEAVRLSVDLGGVDEWPTLLADCAKAADVTLPNLKPEGAPVTWALTQIPDGRFPVLPLVTVNPASTLNDALGVNGATTLRLDTGHEDIKATEGDVRFGQVHVVATVHRPQLQTFKESVIGLLVDGLPDIAKEAVASIISGPISGITSQLDALTNESGSTFFGVSYHEPNEETPAPSQATASPGASPTVRPSSKPGGGTVQTPKPHPSPQPKGGENPCADGCGESVGDPHLQTLDGQEYDFQAAGEFTLLRSPDGSMEMQARQVPYPDIADVSINTALAWLVAGHRVAAYGDDNGYSLTIDHAPVDADSGTVDLGSGAAVTTMAEGIEVAFPDGTISTALSHGGGFAGALDIEIAPSPTFRDQATGLLAHLADGSELPAMPDGSVLPLATDRLERYHQRYEVLAPAWHVTDQTSLFDYGPGQTTATYDVAGFPSPNVAFDINEFEARQGLAAVEQAAEQCAAVGGSEKVVAKCIFDVLATNNPTFARVYELISRFLTDGPNALEECRPPDLPAGFAALPCVQSVYGERLSADGTLYEAVQTGTGSEVVALDPSNGAISRSRGFQNARGLALAGGSVWVSTGNFVNNTAACAVQRLDPATLQRVASINLSCSAANSGVPPLVASPDTVWVVDGSALRQVDFSSNQLGNPVPLPAAPENSELLATGSAFYASVLSDTSHWYRLVAGESAFTDLGNVGGFGDAVAGGGALWVPDVNGAARFTASGTSDGAVAFDGQLVAADESALYVDQSDATSGHSELWRYPIDGSAASQIAENDVSVPLLFGSLNLNYADSGTSVLTAGQRAVATWHVAQGTASSIYMQPISLP